MAISASRVTTGGVPYRIVGNKKETVTDVTFDSSYPTGGEAVTASDLGLSNLEEVVDLQVKTVGGTVNVANIFFDEVNSKLKVYDETPAEVADTATLATLVVRVRARGY
jgi:hypothetical protein